MPTTREPVPVFAIARAGGSSHWFWGPEGWVRDSDQAYRYYDRDGWKLALASTLTDPLLGFECFIHCYDWSL